MASSSTSTAQTGNHLGIESPYLLHVSGLNKNSNRLVVQDPLLKTTQIKTSCDIIKLNEVKQQEGGNREEEEEVKSPRPKGIPAPGLSEKLKGISQGEQNKEEKAQGTQQFQRNQDNNDKRIIGHYHVGKTLGEGTFGKVRLGTHTLTGEKVAIKILEKDKIAEKADIQRVTREIQILKIVRHPNVIQLYEIIETNRQLFLIMEYASGGELFDHIVKKKRLEEKEACRYFQQILSGIEYLHKNQICHRDLKPENLLLDERQNLKIVDFGLSNTYKAQGETLKTACGSPCYAAPEMIAGKRYHGLQADIWSLGIILYAMVCGYLPFEDPNTTKLYKKILTCDYLIPGFVSAHCKDMIKKILNIDPQLRFRAAAIRKHPWYLLIESVEMEGIVVGKEPIPIIENIKIQLQERHANLEGVEMAETFIKMNKHNPVTTTYYLLLKKTERDTGKNILFERVTHEKRNYYSTGNLTATSRPSLSTYGIKNGGAIFRGFSQQLGATSSTVNGQAMNQTTSGELFISKDQLKDKVSEEQGSGEDKIHAGSTAGAQSMIVQSNMSTINRGPKTEDLNPVTKKLLQKIEKNYSSLGNVYGEPGLRAVDAQLFAKYKAMRDTVIDIGKWIKKSSQGAASEALAITDTRYDKPFLEQRKNRDLNKVGENTTFNNKILNQSATNQAAMRQTSYNKQQKFIRTPEAGFNQTRNDGFPIVSSFKMKSSDQKAVIQRLTMYNYGSTTNTEKLVSSFGNINSTEISSKTTTTVSQLGNTFYPATEKNSLLQSRNHTAAGSTNPAAAISIPFFDSEIQPLGAQNPNKSFNIGSKHHLNFSPTKPISKAPDFYQTVFTQPNKSVADGVKHQQAAALKTHSSQLKKQLQNNVYMLAYNSIKDENKEIPQKRVANNFGIQEQSSKSMDRVTGGSFACSQVLKKQQAQSPGNSLIMYSTSGKKFYGGVQKSTNRAQNGNQSALFVPNLKVNENSSSQMSQSTSNIGIFSQLLKRPARKFINQKNLDTSVIGSSLSPQNRIINNTQAQYSKQDIMILPLSNNTEVSGSTIKIQNMLRQNK